MAENFYSVKTALHVGIVQIVGGLISIGIGAFNTRKEDHQAFFKFKAEGLPVWSGILVSMKLTLKLCRTRKLICAFVTSLEFSCLFFLEQMTFNLNRRDLC